MHRFDQADTKTAEAFANLNIALIRFDVCIQQKMTEAEKIPCNIPEQAKQASLASIDLESMMFRNLFE